MDKFKKNRLQIAKDLIKEFLVSEYGEEENEIKFNDISHIPVAHTQTEDGEHDIDVVVDLKNFSINKHLDGRVVKSITSRNIEELIENELNSLDFSELVYLDDEIVNEFNKRNENTKDNHWEYIELNERLYEKGTSFDTSKQNEILGKIDNLEKELLKIGYTQGDLLGMRKDAYVNADAQLNTKNHSQTIKKGDYIKTGANDNTLVLKVKDNDAILFTGNQFIVAHGIQKDGDRAYWAYGDYYNELPEDVFSKSEVIEDRLKEGIISLVNKAYNKIDKALTDDSKEYTEYRIAQGLDDILEIKRILEGKEIGLEDDWELEP